MSGDDDNQGRITELIHTIITEGVKSVFFRRVVVVTVVKSPDVSPATNRINAHRQKNHKPSGARALNL